MSRAETPERRPRRIPVRVPVRVSSIDAEKDPWTGRSFLLASPAVCGNLSRGGACIQTADPPAPGRRILMEMELPDGSDLELVGRVAWSRMVLAPGEQKPECSVGIEFLGGTGEQIRALESFLEHPPKPSAD